MPRRDPRRQNPLLLRLSGKTLIPDALSGLGYPADATPRFRFFALEVDRGTETIDRADLRQTSYGSKLPIYLDLMRRRIFTEHWGIPYLLVLTVTTRLARMHNMMEHFGGLTEHEPRLRARFLFRYEPDLAGGWTVPPVMHRLFDEPCERVDCDSMLLARA